MLIRAHTTSGTFSDDIPLLGIRVGDAAALAVISLTASAPVDVAAVASPPATILPANSARAGATIVNASLTNLHLNFVAPPGGGPAELIVAPGGSASTPERYAGVVTGWWEGPVSGKATVTEIHF